MMAVTKQLSSYIVETKYEDIPPAVIDRAKNLLLHTVGVSLAALELQQGKDAITIAKEFSSGNGSGAATLWGTGRKGSWEAAALLAGTLGDMLDWEDCSWTGHPSAGVIPSALVAAEALHKSGKELLTAIVVAYEVYQRIAMAVPANINGINIFASVVAVAKLYDLNEEQVNQALGLAAASSAVNANIHEASGKDLITAAAGAYEIYQRVVNAAKPEETSRVGITSWQIFGTTAAAAKLYDFTPEQTDRAFGMAAELSTIPVGYRKDEISDFYHFEHGYRARDGILIAREVQLGIHNARGVLDDTRPSGYLASVTASPRPEWLTKELGNRYLILEITEEPHKVLWEEKDVERFLHIEEYDISNVVSFLVS